VTCRAESKIFIVDDDESIRDSLTTLLKSEGWEVDAFENGHDFLEAYAPIKGGCLLLDLNMPIMSGHEVIKALNAKGYKIPVIVITSVEDTRIKSRLLNLGVTEVITKPLNHELLFETINQVI